MRAIVILEVNGGVPEAPIVFEDSRTSEREAKFIYEEIGSRQGQELGPDGQFPNDGDDDVYWFTVPLRKGPK